MQNSEEPLARSEELDTGLTIEPTIVIDEEAARARLLSKKSFFLLIIGFFLLYLGANFLDVWYAARSSSTQEAPTAIVLGAAQYNGVPSPVLEARLDVAAKLYSSGQVQKIVVTGGKQEGDISSEASAGSKYLRKQVSIDDDKLELEVGGSSTYESLAATANFLGEDDRKVILVTDPFHAKRAQLVAKEVGLDAEVATTGAPYSTKRLVRETAAVSVGRIISFRRLEKLG